MEHVMDEGMDASAREDAAKGQPVPLRLEDIESPDQLRGLSVDALAPLAGEIRDYLVSVAAQKGGHFAPSLGVVELTLALHYVYETPRDQIAWDVGHQAYVHKILTGRREQLRTIRQDHGISGFLKRNESEYDAFGAGHASTAPSAALGLAAGRDLLGDDRHVVAVIGDGAMTGGLAFEALNNAGTLGSNVLVVLNDNAMSISPNVGAVAQYLTTLTTHPYYRRVRDEAHAVIKRLPRVGDVAANFAKRLEAGLKGAVVPGALFQALGFTYLGPIDGHDINELVDVLKRVRGSIEGPVLLHVLTHKGKGYAPAEADPCKWHGVGPFDPATGGSPAKAEPAVKKPEALPSYTKAYSDALIDLAERRKEFVAITAAMSTGTGLDAFQERFPDRFFDVGIAEGHGVTFAAGLAAQGIRPVCTIYSTFLQRAYDHVLHDAAIQKLPVIFAMDRGGLVGADGPTHHGCFDLAYLRTIPDLVLAAPKDADELADLLETAAEYTDGPFAFRYPRGEVPAARTRPPKVLPIGSWEMLREDGEDVVFLTLGAMVPGTLAAADELAAEGHGVSVVNARFVKPLDIELLRRVTANAKVVVAVEEGTRCGGFGAALLEASVEHDMRFADRLVHCAIPDAFITHGSRDRLLEICGLLPAQIADAARKRLG